MLEKKDLELIAETVDRIIEKRIEPLKKDIAVLKTDVAVLKADVDGLKSMDKLILDEVEREHNITEKGINKVQKNLDELNQYYKITKLENDNISLILRMTQGFSKRLEALERKMA